MPIILGDYDEKPMASADCDVEIKPQPPEPQPPECDCNPKPEPPQPEPEPQPQQRMVVGMAYVPWQKWQQPYDYEKGLEVGTIFPDLDLPFLGYQGGMKK